MLDMSDKGPALRVAEVAGRLGTSKYTVRKLIRTGRLAAFQHGDNSSPFLVWEHDLNDYLERLDR